MRARKLMLGLLLSVLLACLGIGREDADGAGEAGKPPVPAPGEKLAVRMLDVGQGDAILIQAGAQTVLVDTSDLDERDKLRQALQEQGVRSIDRLVLTHPHADHIGGAGMLLKELSVGEVCDNGMPSASKLYLGYRKLQKSKGIPHRALAAGDVLELGNGAVLEALYPTAELAKAGRQQGYEHHPNNESIVLRLAYGDFSMLFTGDAEREEEQALLAAYPKERLKSTVLKAPHHGSRTSADDAFLRAVSPQAVLISAGEPGAERGNVYGHPHKAALRAYLRAGVKEGQIYWTHKNGTIAVETDGKNCRIVPARKKEWLREWMSK